MFLQINRKIFNFLNEELKNTYIYELVQKESSDFLNYEEEVFVSNAIVSMLNKNEEWHKTYGVLRQNGMIQVDEDCMVPGGSEISGYYQIGKLLIIPFDWSWDEKGDFDYSFNVVRTI